MDDFKNLFNDASKDVKEKFLYKQLSLNEPLRAKFLAFVKEKKKEALDNQKEEAHYLESRKEIIFALEDVDFEEYDWEEFEEEFGEEVEEWQAMEMMGQKRIDDLFDELERDIFEPLEDGDVYESVVQLLCLYEACLKAIIPSNPTFVDPNALFVDKWRAFYKEYLLKLEQETIDTDMAQKAIHCIAMRHKSEPDIINPQLWEELISMLLCDKEAAEYAEEILLLNGISKELAPNVFLAISYQTGNITQWLRISEETYLKDIRVARKLLEYYEEHNRDKFLKIADSVFENLPSEFADYLHMRITDEEAPNLYVNIVKYLIDFRHDIDLFRELKPIITEKDKDEFIDSQKYSPSFYGKLLAEEERYDELLDFAKGFESDSYFADIIKLVYNKYPEDSFDIIKSRILETLQLEVGAIEIKNICEWLLVMKDIDEMTAETTMFMSELTSKYEENLDLMLEMQRRGLT